MYKRTNIEIDLDLIHQVMESFNLKTIKEAVNFSLRQMIESNKRANLFKMKGKVKWDGDLEEMRKI